MSSARIIPSFLALLALTACDRRRPTSDGTSSSSAGAGTTTTTMALVDGSSKKEPIVTWKNIGLSTPECVVHDDAADIYIVSNISGKPLDADNDGFISRLTPDGKVESLKWIAGGKKRVTLNAPKGIGLMGDNLYVADIDTVRIFDRKSGEPTGEVRVPGAVFLNDVAITTDGHVLVSDTGGTASGDPRAAADTDAVYALDKAKTLVTIAKTPDLAAPNGLFASGDKIWVSSFASNELYVLDAKGRRLGSHRLPRGALDGIVMLPGGDFLVASWEGSAIYRGRPDASDARAVFRPVIEDTRSPADIGYDLKRTRVLVPLFESDEVRAYEMR